MATATTTLLGHVERALSFFNESENFVGFAKTTAWADETSPPTPDPAARNIGMVISESWSGTSMTSANAKANINRNLFTGGSQTFIVKALTSSTYEVRDANTNTLQGNTSYATQTAARSNIVTGLDIKVSGTLVANDSYTFTADGAIGFKKVSVKYLVVPDSSGTITYNSQKYLIVDPTDARDLNARWVYVETEFDYSELPIQPFRQLGIFSNLVRNNGVTADILLPNQISSTGSLVVLDNRKVIYRSTEQREIISYIIEH